MESRSTIEVFDEVLRNYSSIKFRWIWSSHTDSLRRVLFHFYNYYYTVISRSDKDSSNHYLWSFFHSELIEKWHQSDTYLWYQSDTIYEKSSVKGNFEEWFWTGKLIISIYYRTREFGEWSGWRDWSHLPVLRPIENYWSVIT